MADYPAALPTFTACVDVDANNEGGTDADATLLNKIHDELLAGLTELGVDAAGGYDTVVLRLDAMDTTISGFLQTDGSVAGATSEAQDFGSNGILADVIAESTAATGVTVDSVLLKDGGFVCADGASGEVDIINEATAAAGVTIDSVLLKDGEVDGVVVDNHDARHERSGADEIDGDHLDIDMTPTAYVPATTPAEAADVDDLAAHLYGIDVALTKFKTGNIWIPARAWHPSTTNGCAAAAKVEYTTNDQDLYQMAFDTTSDEHAQVTLAMPADWGAGTITFVPYWTTATGDGGAAETVCWALQGRAYANDDAIDQAWGTAQTSTDTWIADLDLHIGPASSAITLAGTPAASQLVQLRLFRDVSGDDLAADAQFIGAMVAYTRSLS